jgi:hypothetical protein
MSVLQHSRFEKWQCAACAILVEWQTVVADAIVVHLLVVHKPRLLRLALGLCSSWRTSRLLHAQLLELLHTQADLCPLVWQTITRHGIIELVDACVDCYTREGLLPAEIREQAWQV